MPWTALCFLVGAVAISGLPPLNGFASEWLSFQALLFGFQASTEPLVRFLFPVAGALLALTSALAAACFVKAFGITSSRCREARRRQPRTSRRRVMLGPQAVLAARAWPWALPGLGARALRGRAGVAAGAPPGAADGPRSCCLAPDAGAFDHAGAAAAGGARLVGLALRVARCR